MNVDVSVEMPSKLLEQGDIADHAYYRKRACYLAALCVFFQDSKYFSDVQYSLAQVGDVLMKGGEV